MQVFGSVLGLLNWEFWGQGIQCILTSPLSDSDPMGHLKTTTISCHLKSESVCQWSHLQQLQ